MRLSLPQPRSQVQGQQPNQEQDPGIPDPSVQQLSFLQQPNREQEAGIPDPSRGHLFYEAGNEGVSGVFLESKATRVSPVYVD